MKKDKKGCAEEHERIQRMFGLVEIAMETNGGFNVRVPQELKNNLSVIESDDVVEQLRHSTWQIHFRNGIVETLTLNDFLLFLYNVRNVGRQINESEEESRRRGGERRTVFLQITTDYSHVADVKVVKELLRELAGR